MSRVQSGRSGQPGLKNIFERDVNSPQLLISHIWILINLDKLKDKSWDDFLKKKKRKKKCSKDNWKSWGKYMAKKNVLDTKELCRIKHDETEISGLHRNPVSMLTGTKRILSVLFSFCLVAADCVQNCILSICQIQLFDPCFLAEFETKRRLQQNNKESCREESCPPLICKWFLIFFAQ